MDGSYSHENWKKKISIYSKNMGLDLGLFSCSNRCCSYQHLLFSSVCWNIPARKSECIPFVWYIPGKCICRRDMGRLCKHPCRNSALL